MDKTQIKNIIEAALMVAGRPLDLDALLAVFGDGARPDRAEIRSAIDTLREEYTDRGIELVEVASGYRIQASAELSDWLSRLWQERPQRYSRALMETLALIAYRQPITRGEIEDVRGVSVSSSIIRTLLERSWVRVVGHRDVPGKPEMFGTTREFLDYFGLRRLDELPSLAELRDLDSFNVELNLGLPDEGAMWSADEEAAEILPNAELSNAPHQDAGDEPDDQVSDIGSEPEPLESDRHDRVDVDPRG
jgi:segregation and condensation protein B